MLKNLDVKILYVEDDAIIRLDIINMIKSKYEHVYIANNGKDGFELFEKNDFDLVITDLAMPISDGIEMINKIREVNQEIPIIVASAFDSEFIKLYNLNVNGFITKPISKFNLLILIENILLGNE